ncbi:MULTISPECIES: ASCH domain-containing protein [Butyricimonas]|uniref:hypothetical protein n=1 Tax=Butyricimonas TaxID=574697 RepID=UPI0007FB488E|nr:MULTISPECIES: hypothetical protein [Butyricimonas]
MKKILFNDKFGLTKAVLEGRKTMTRRIIPRRLLASYQFKSNVTPGYEKDFFLKHSPYKIGEIIAIAQSYNSFYDETYNPTLFPPGKGWDNKMFVKASLMPHAIEITDVRVERLQDITSEDCLREGIEKFDVFGTPSSYIFSDAKNNIYPKGWCTEPKEAFALLIDKVSGKGTWDSNPWVFAYTFELK